MSRTRSLKSTAKYAGWLLLKRLGYDPHQMFRSSFVDYYRMCRRLPR